MNNVNLIGRITKDLEIKMTKADSPMLSFTLACKRRLNNKNGEKLTDFFNCVVFGSKAEFLNEYARKSTLIGIEGRLQSKVYLDDSGNRHSTVVIICETVQILRSPTASENTQVKLEKEEETVFKIEEVEELLDIEKKETKDPKDKTFDDVMSDFSSYFED